MSASVHQLRSRGRVNRSKPGRYAILAGQADRVEMIHANQPPVKKGHRLSRHARRLLRAMAHNWDMPGQ